MSIDGSITGTATLAAKGVGAHILLAANLTDTWYFTFPLASRSYALAIDGFGEVDFAVGEFVAGGYHMQGNVGMKFGFDMAVSSFFSTFVSPIDMLERLTCFVGA